jgi:hypothetical protein
MKNNIEAKWAAGTLGRITTEKMTITPALSDYATG